MFKKILLSAVLATGFASGAIAEPAEIVDESFSFEGPFGRFDAHQLQRGLQVFTDVCSSCHGIKYVYYRNLSDAGGLGWTEEQMKAYTGQFEVFDQTLSDGDGDFRTATPADRFPENNGVGAPDLSLMAKARAGFEGPNGLAINQLFKGLGGPEYIVAFLGGFTGEEKEQAGTILYENTIFPGGWTAMSPPLLGDDVEYADGTETSVYQESMDVAAFLMWTAEPKMMDRKNGAAVWVAFLIFLTILLFLTNKKIWAHAKRKD